MPSSAEKAMAAMHEDATEMRWALTGGLRLVHEGFAHAVCVSGARIDGRKGIEEAIWRWRGRWRGAP